MIEHYLNLPTQADKKYKLPHTDLTWIFFRFRLLETKLESTLKSSLEIKEEKIAALEARLQESSNLNQQLRQELKTVRNTYPYFRSLKYLLSTEIQYFGYVVKMFSSTRIQKTNLSPPENSVSKIHPLQSKTLKTLKYRGLLKADTLFINPLFHFYHQFIYLWGGGSLWKRWSRVEDVCFSFREAFALNLLTQIISKA